MSNDDFHFKWNSYSDHCTELLQNINNTKNFSDITLVCEDLTQINVHKVVLSACSPVFKKLISSNPHPLPLIFLRGVSREVLKSLVDFMYLGETSFSQHGMENFLKCARELEVKNLVNADDLSLGNSNESNSEIQKEVGKLFRCGYCELKLPKESSLIKHLATAHSKYNEAKKLLKETREKGISGIPFLSETLTDNEIDLHDKIPTETFLADTTSGPKQIPEAEKPEPEKENIFEAKLEFDEEEIWSNSNSEDRGFETLNSNLSSETNINPITMGQKCNVWRLDTYFTKTTNNQYECSECSKKYSNRSSFGRHFQEAHLGRKFTCDICGMKSTQKSGLARHKKDVHKES